MKKQNRILLFSMILLFVCFAVVACKDIADHAANQKSTSDEVASLRMQLDYYENRVTSLESELTAAKVELYLQRSEYEKQLLALESSAAPQEATDEPESNSSPVWFREETEGGIVINGVANSSERLEIPDMLDGLPVIAIGENAFANEEFTSVVLPDTLREIGWFAFSGCRDLTSVSIPASVEKIGYGAFENCPKSLQILCVEGSFAAAFARSYGYSVKTD